VGHLLGFNAVEAALETGRRTVERIWVEKGKARGRLERLKGLARRHGVRVEEVDRRRLEQIAGDLPRSAHQGVVASVAEIPYATTEDVLAGCGERAIVLVADGIEDPRNLGALVRTAAGAGVRGVFIPDRRAAGLTATAARAAAGAAERVPIARAGNVAALIGTLQEADFWVIGLDAGSDRPWDRIDYPRRLALVVGGEGQGLRRLVRERCDEVVSIPLEMGVESLNVSVAAGICLYEAVRQGRARDGGGTPGG